jgi:hypothetical protein
MANKHIVIVAFLIMSSFFTNTSCKSAAGPDGVDNTPKDKSVSVQYIRIQPYDSSYGGDIVILRWNYANYTGAAGMTKVAENNFSCGAQIKTETKTSITAEDMWKLNPWVRRRLFIDGHELIFTGPDEGNIEFIYHNDGSIEITSTK